MSISKNTKIVSHEVWTGNLNLYSLGLRVLEEDEWPNQLINYSAAVCRTAPAAPDLTIIPLNQSYQ